MLEQLKCSTVNLSTQAILADALPPPSSCNLAVQEMEAKAREAEAKAARASASARKDYWLQPGLVVKVVAKELEKHGYYKKKVGCAQAKVQAWAGLTWAGAELGAGFQ